MTHNATILSGKKGITEGYERMLKEEALDIVCLASSYQQVVGDFFDRQYAPQLYTLRTREILPDTKENRDYATTKGQKNQVHFLRAESESDMVIGKNQVLLVSFNKSDPFALLISDAGLVSQFQAQFEAMWSKG